MGAVSFSLTSAPIQRGFSQRPHHQSEQPNGHSVEEQMDHTQHTPGGFRGLMRSPAGTVILALLSAAVIYALVAHTAHTFALLPYAFILLCPLMHLFMHRGHGGHGSGGDDQEHRH
jgi:Flp pilus assembly protein TadB